MKAASTATLSKQSTVLHREKNTNWRFKEKGIYFNIPDIHVYKKKSCALNLTLKTWADLYKGQYGERSS